MHCPHFRIAAAEGSRSALPSLLQETHVFFSCVEPLLSFGCIRYRSYDALIMSSIIRIIRLSSDIVAVDEFNNGDIHPNADVR